MNKKILLILMISLFFIGIITIHPANAIIWTHSPDQVPFDGCQVKYSGFICNVSADNIPPIQNFIMNSIYTDLPNGSFSQDILIQGDVGAEILLIINISRIISFSIVVIGDARLFTTFISPNSYTIFWIYNNLSIGNRIPFVTLNLTIFEIVPVKVTSGISFNCYHTLWSLDSKYLFNYIEGFYDIRTGTLIKLISYVSWHPDDPNSLVKSAYIEYMEGNIPGGSTGLTTNQIILIAGVGIGIFTAIILIGKRSTIKSYFIKPKKDMRKKRKRKN